MKHVLIDTNVAIHYLVTNPKFYASASKIFTLGLQRKISLYVTVLTYSNTFYVLNRFNDRKKVIEKLQALSAWTIAVPTSYKSVQKALFSPFTDFEDAIQNYTAEDHPLIDTLITNNTKDFKHSMLKVFDTDQYLAALKTA